MPTVLLLPQTKLSALESKVSLEPRNGEDLHTGREGQWVPIICISEVGVRLSGPGSNTFLPNPLRDTLEPRKQQLSLENGTLCTPAPQPRLTPGFLLPAGSRSWEWPRTEAVFPPLRGLGWLTQFLTHTAPSGISYTYMVGSIWARSERQLLYFKYIIKTLKLTFLF